jgi:Tol biopolymer transport system component
VTGYNRSALMPLLSGTRLGPYEILAPLGAGGMGEVYRAKDTKLKREVALKVLPEAFARDSERMTRFRHEAEVLAALNHPGIAAIYGLEEGALIMELVEGETLSSPLPIDTALRYARQIAEALEFAHERGVIHRDLKPANVKVTPEGTVKVLDFGLAKTIEDEPTPGGDPSKSPTRTLEVTAMGVIMGTAAYMSPEQAGGKEADRRADIWSFGAVLYEMLSGQRAFQGESVSDTLASVLKVDPDWNALPASTPAPIRKLVRLCLTKDRKQRLQAIGDARIAIDEVLAGAPGEEASAPAAGSRRSILAWAAAASVLAIVAGIGWWMAWRSTRPANLPLLRLSVDLGPDALASDRITAAISPDGTRLAFAVRGPDGKQQLGTRLLDQPQATLLSGTEDGGAPFFSPNGQWIGFFAERKMKKVSVRGGAVLTLCDANEGRGAAWGEDDRIIATLNSSPATGLSRIPAAGGTPQEITHPGERGEATHRWPQILPGGQAVLFMGSKTASNYDDSSIEVLSLKTGQVKIVQPGGYYGRYLPGGYLVYIHQGTLFGVPFDLDRLEVHGTPAVLQEDVAGNSSNGAGQFDFSGNGTFVYASGKSASGTWSLEWLDGAGKTQPLLAAPGIYYNPRLSPDGKRLAFSTNSAIEVYDIGRDTTTQLTFTNQTKTNLNPVWTPDGKHIVFQSQGNSNFSLQWIRADGSGEAQQLLEGKNDLKPRSFSPDSKHLAFEELSAETGFDLWTLPLDLSDPERPKPGTPELFLRTPFSEQEPEFSPDGRWIAYASEESGRSEVYVRPFPAAGPSGSGKWLISTGGGDGPRWSRNGAELFYKGPDNRIMTASYTANAGSFASSKPRPWANKQISGELDAAPDGKRFVIAVSPRADAAGEAKGSVHVTFLLNFFDEVRRRVSAGK